MPDEVIIWGDEATSTVYLARNGYNPAVLPPSGYHCHCPVYNYNPGICLDCYIDPKRTLTFSNWNWYTSCSLYALKYIKIDSVTMPASIDVYYKDEGGYSYGWQATSGSITYSLYGPSKTCEPSALTHTTTTAFKFLLSKSTTIVNKWIVSVVLENGTSAYPNTVFFNDVDHWYADGGYCNFQFPTSGLPNKMRWFTTSAAATCTLS